MHRCFIENERWHTNTVIPSPEETHHLVHVLRVRDGESIRIFNGCGKEADAVLHGDDDAGIRLEIRKTFAGADRPFELVLIQAVLKGNRMDLLIEKATELGVSRILPVITQRVIPRFDTAPGRQKQDRWERIAISAAKQCGTPWLPIIEAPLSLDIALQSVASGGPVLLAALEGQPRPLAAVIDEMRIVSPSSISVIIGPEGDLTPEENRRTIDTGAIPVSLGRLTLRAETAAIYAVSALTCMLRPA